MPGLNLITTINYSPNFQVKKRKKSEIKFLVFHYTGMKKEKDAIKRLTSKKSKVSSHYFIKKNGEIITLVPNSYIAWHAGVSAWNKYKFLNKYSIGIEISNPGHEFKYTNFKNKQIKSVLKLSRFLIRKYNINSKFIVGHSDISPNRKKDPGEKFPWKYLSKKNIGYWHNLNQKKLINYRSKNVSDFEKNTFIENLYKIGYSKNLINKNTKLNKILTIAFQRRFRQELINGKIDKECILICENISKKYK